ncbi:MAG TPA: hypothetical protein VI172_08360 [Candidatus Dormibacteraeota bacterium]
MSSTLYALIAEDDTGLHLDSTEWRTDFDTALDDIVEGNRQRAEQRIPGRWRLFALTEINKETT